MNSEFKAPLGIYKLYEFMNSGVHVAKVCCRFHLNSVSRNEFWICNLWGLGFCSPLFLLGLRVLQTQHSF